MGYRDLQVLLLLLLGVCAFGNHGLAQTPPPPSPTSSIDLPPSGSPPDLIPSRPPPSTNFQNWTAEKSIDNGNKIMLTSTNKKFSFNLLVANQPNHSSCAAVVQHNPSKVTVWVANFIKTIVPNNQPEVTKCFFNFTEDGLMLASDVGKIWNSQDLLVPSKELDVLELDDRGCLLLKNGQDSPVWKSFDNPSDIIITGQLLNVSKEIFAARLDTNYSCQDKIRMRVDSTQVTLSNGITDTKLFDVSTVISYVTMQNGLRAFAGNESIYSTSDISYESESLWEYARLDPSGRLVIASYVDVRAGSSNGGEIYGLCLTKDKCDCPRGFNSSVSSSGFTCKRNVILDRTRCMEDTLVNVTGKSYSGFMTDSVTRNVTVEVCNSLCLKNCSCTMALHEKPNAASQSGNCYWNLGDSVQIILQTSTNDSGLLTGINEIGLQTLFLRIVNYVVTTPGAGDGPSTKSSRKTVASAFAGGAGALAFVLLALSAWFLYDSRRKLFGDAENGKFDSVAAELLSTKLLPQFTYQELVESTGNFAQKLGSGGFSCVYAGHLPDNTKIAVKKLDDNEHKEKEFLAAVATVGSISHANLVSLRGFCKEGQHRILVYELVNEGRSLNWFLFPLQNSSLFINAQTRRSIALGTARGLAHLHENCKSSSVLHGGVKPENIVIDRKMHPRLVDFGLISLMSRDQRLSEAQMRGSRGYMAPEWVKSQPITEKVDVYSLGIVILELVSGRRCLKQGASQEKCFLPTWGFSLLRHSEDDPDCVLELADPLLDVRNLPATDQQVLKGMIYVALWCVQEEPSMRPPMKVVVRMLEGDASVDTPPYSPALDAFAREMCSGYAGERAPESSNNSFMHSNSLKRNSDMRPR